MKRSYNTRRVVAMRSESGAVSRSETERIASGGRSVCVRDFAQEEKNE